MCEASMSVMLPRSGTMKSMVRLLHSLARVWPPGWRTAEDVRLGCANPCRVVRGGGQGGGASRAEILRVTNKKGCLKPGAWRKLCEDGHLDVAFQALERMGERGTSGFKDMLYRILKVCIARRNLFIGTLVHDLVVSSGYEANPFLGNHVIRMYASHGRLVEASQVFSKLDSPTPFVWSSMISAHSEHGQAEQAINLYQRMIQSGSQPDHYVFVAVLKACGKAADLTSGKLVHGDVVESGLESNMFVGNTLVDMYGKCGSLEDARRVFDRMPVKDLVTWSAIIAAYAQHGLGQEALTLFASMEQHGIRPDSVAFVSMLKACSSAGAIDVGKRIHQQVMDWRLEGDLYVANSLVDLYAKCGSFSNAQRLFDNMPDKTLVTWNALIAGYAQHGFSEEALKAYVSMEQQGIVPDSMTFMSLLKACNSVSDGKRLHAEIVRKKLEEDVYVINSLLDMYTRCGSLQDSRDLFNRLSTKNVVTWNSLITAHAQNGLDEEALKFFVSMQAEGIKPDGITFTNILRSCGTLGAILVGRRVHAQILEVGLERDVLIANTIVDMYLKCRDLDDARNVFDRLHVRDIVTWNAMIAGYMQHQCTQEALALYVDMRHSGMSPDSFTLASVLKACGSTADIHAIQLIHAEIVDKGLEGDEFIGNILVNLYTNCGRLEDACRVFYRLPARDVVAWSTLIAGYVHQGLDQKALELFLRMQESGVAPDTGTYMVLLKACGRLGSIEEGRQIHAQIVQRGLGMDVSVGSSLIDMYSKCGNLENAQKVFDKLLQKDVVAWTALIDGYGQHNDCRMAMKCFEEMQQHGLAPDATAFTCILVACSHVGLVDEGLWYFKQMIEEHGITPTPEHYNCMVDLLGRSGRLDEAENLLQTVPYEQRTVGWMSLLSASKMHGNQEQARRSFDKLVSMELHHPSAYALMSRTYADEGREEDADAIENLRKLTGAQKEPATALVVVNDRMYEFVVGQERDDIASKLKSLNLQMSEGDGEVADKKANALCGHAEKLAVAFGLLNTPDGTPLVVMKNLRMCTNCHSGTKIISRLENREIVIRDGHRVHHFKDGLCSCGDDL